MPATAACRNQGTLNSVLILLAVRYLLGATIQHSTLSRPALSQPSPTVIGALHLDDQVLSMVLCFNVNIVTFFSISTSYLQRWPKTWPFYHCRVTQNWAQYYVLAPNVSTSCPRSDSESLGPEFVIFSQPIIVLANPLEVLTVYNMPVYTIGQYTISRPNDIVHNTLAQSKPVRGWTCYSNSRYETARNIVSLTIYQALNYIH